MNRVLLLLIALSTCIASQLAAKNFHVLLTADTLTDVKRASNKDLKHLKREAHHIAQVTGMKLYLKELSGHQLTQHRFEEWLTKSEISPDDVVFFYYTGHGLRTEKTPTVWPSIYFPPKKEVLDFHQLVKKITARPAALLITIADCCNNFIDHPKSRFSLHDRGWIAKSTIFGDGREALKKLFLHTQGVIIASGSVPGKRSWCTEKGGLFTNALLASLREELREVNPQWEHLFKKASIGCSNIQQPQFYLKIRYSKWLPASRKHKTRIVNLRRIRAKELVVENFISN
jgi:hypothetical protein